VVEYVMPFPVDFFVEATPADVAAEAWLVPDYVDADGHYLMSFHTAGSHHNPVASVERRDHHSAHPRTDQPHRWTSRDQPNTKPHKRTRWKHTQLRANLEPALALRPDQQGRDTSSGTATASMSHHTGALAVR
jgi:hypothetical protein